VFFVLHEEEKGREEKKGRREEEKGRKARREEILVHGKMFRELHDRIDSIDPLVSADSIDC
jgi:5'-3' exonuclease